MKPYRIIIVDDHPIFGSGLATLLNAEPNLEVVGHALTVDEGLSEYKRLAPDLIISDLSFMSSSGLLLIKQIRDLPSSCPILVMSMHDETFWAQQVLQQGANGYIQKNASTDEVINAIQNTADGLIYLSKTMEQRLLRQLSGHTVDNGPLEVLSRREKEIFQYLAQGLTSDEIASRLFISLKTVQTHQSNIKKKLKQGTIKDLRKLARNQANEGLIYANN